MLSALFGRHQEFLLDDLRRRRAFGLESKFELSDDPVQCGIIGDEGDHSHLCTACRTEEGVYFIDFADHLGPASGRDIQVGLINQAPTIYLHNQKGVFDELNIHLFKISRWA